MAIVDLAATKEKTHPLASVAYVRAHSVKPGGLLFGRGQGTGISRGVRKVEHTLIPTCYFPPHPGTDDKPNYSGTDQRPG